MQRVRVAALVIVIGALHVAGFAALAAGLVSVGLGLTAYTLGARHAFDADHIAAIDGTTRRLMTRGERPVSVGFFFALGHSTVVFGAAALLALGVHVIGAHSALATVTRLVGPLVSVAFLSVIGVLNLGVLAETLRALRDGGTEAAAPTGPLSLVYARATRAVRAPWQMYPLGVLFGLGFDTATEVGLLVLAAGAVSGGLPIYAALALPVLFAAGMTLLDTLDGSFMSLAYGWALARPVRKLFYNAVITALSAGVALLVAAVEVAGLVWPSAERVDLNAIGFGVVALFAFTWLLAVAVWRFGRLEERLSQ